MININKPLIAYLQKLLTNNKDHCAADKDWFEKTKKHDFTLCTNLKHKNFIA